MAAQPIPSVVSTSSLAALKPIQILRSLQRLLLSGQLLFTQAQGQQWSFYLYLGRLVYATGGMHSVRRWHRNLAVHCPQIASHGSTWQRDLTSIDATNCWDYQLLCLWVRQQKISREQAARMIRSIIVEALFDLGQTANLTHQTQKNQSLPVKLVLIEIEQVIAELQPLWQAWQSTPLVSCSPNQAPVIKQPELLRKNGSEQVYQTLTHLLNGRRTLRDLAVQSKRDIVDVARSLQPYVQAKWVELIIIPDLPVPTPTTTPIPPRTAPTRVNPVPSRTPPTTANPTTTSSTKALVACVDDSLWVIRTMEKVIAAAGYQFLGVNDPLRAIPILLARKPNLIFLDLVMPNINGYEICTQLRKLSCFRQTPIVILTGKDGAADRIHAKFVGASDFLSKPLDARKLLDVLRKHLSQGVTVH
ncbi:MULTISPECIES: response regulator [unclassified Coleofasciculus]|uniref:response regulator n=1 Tax=unclassified Coleofasciculus TaxID=2692782 RepID=UPI001882E4B1|nr:MULTISPECIES: response regulator [unclassified Coleofasciculus]MBE9125837.1 response regulator [Coleofasciculus sp. LEGE 07081]MBE9149155.1 response regulator [Coleofasciculus sp. LEGE 07092]